jgi:hypothetical protein
MKCRFFCHIYLTFATILRPKTSFQKISERYNIGGQRNREVPFYHFLILLRLSSFPTQRFDMLLVCQLLSLLAIHSTYFLLQLISRHKCTFFIDHNSDSHINKMKEKVLNMPSTPFVALKRAVWDKWVGGGATRTPWLRLAQAGCLLAAGVLGDGLGALGDGVLGQLAGQNQTDGGLDFAGRDGGALVVVGQSASLGGDPLEHVVHERAKTNDINTEIIGFGDVFSLQCESSLLFQFHLFLCLSQFNKVKGPTS